MAKFITTERKLALGEQFRRAKKALGELWVYLPMETPADMSENLERLRKWLYENDPDPTFKISRDRQQPASSLGRRRKSNGTRVGDRGVPGQEGESVRPPSKD